MKIKFTRDVPGKRPRKKGDVAEYKDETAKNLIAARVAEPATPTDTTNESSRHDPPADPAGSPK